LLVLIGALFIFLGARLKSPVGVRQPGKAAAIFMVVIWVMSIFTFLVAIAAYAVQMREMKIVPAPPPNPITDFTYTFAAITFIVIVYLTRKHGTKLAVLSAFVGTAAAPLIFEFPFDLIVISRTCPVIPPSPTLYRLLFFMPLFMVEFSTFSLLTFSPLMKVSRSTLYVLAAFFFTLAFWAMFGFSYPANPLYFIFNVVSKALCFVAAATLFSANFKGFDRG
jgi:vacuolar-type H+-ATPase subunit I/STV1